MFNNSNMWNTNMLVMLTVEFILYKKNRLGKHETIEWYLMIYELGIMIDVSKIFNYIL